MKKIKILAFALAALLMSGLASSCVGDLDVTPIDPNTEIPEDVLNSDAAFAALLAKVYQGLCVSSSSGPSGDPDIEGIDGGFGQYMRALFYMQELTTDTAICPWNDGTLYDLHNMCWTTSNEYIYAMYSRIFYQISLANEFIRQSNNTTLSDTEYPNKAAYIAEARALRLISYYHAIDLFGNVPFTTEESSVGSTGPEQISREDLFNWMENECRELLDGSNLAEVGQNVYGRADKGVVMMILAKLYLNAEVWKGTSRWDDCANVCEDIINAYPDLYPTYGDLFLADNHELTVNQTYGTASGEIIYAVQQDGLLIQSYGATNFLIFAATGGDMDLTYMGISSGWGGLSLTGVFTSKFDLNNDARASFYTTGYDQYVDEIRRSSDGWSNGYKSMKFRNVKRDNTAAQSTGFVDTDLPLFRTADAYLMYAECTLHGAGDSNKGTEYFNEVRTRAGLGSLNLTSDNLIDERGRELYWEGMRRQDLIRFGLYTTSDYLWEFKGGEQAGVSVDSKYNLLPLPSSDVNANSNLTQNPSY